MGEWLLRLLLPHTDRVVFIQVVIAAVIYPALYWRFRASKDARFFIGACAFATFAFFGLRSAH